MAAEKELRKNAAERNTKPFARRFSLFLYTVAAFKIQLLRGLDVPARVISFSALSAV